MANDVKMDVGFDLNDTANTHLFYNTFGVWYPSQTLVHGAVMMRPILGTAIPFGVGVDEINADDSGITIYPNPVNDVLYVTSSSANSWKLEVMDYTGRVLYAENNA